MGQSSPLFATLMTEPVFSYLQPSSHLELGIGDLFIHQNDLTADFELPKV